MKPSEYIEALVASHVDDRLKKARGDDTSGFMLTLMGTSDEEFKAAARREPLVWIGAIIAWLDSQQVVPLTGNSPTDAKKESRQD